MEDELEEMTLRHHRSAAVAGASRHQQHRRRAKKAASVNTSYDDVFGGPPRHAVPLSGVPEDYSEVFGGVSVSCSIPFLDLPAMHGGWGDEETGSGVDYGEIFGRCEFADFAVPYEELFGKGRRRMEEEEEGEVELHFTLDNGRSSFKSRSGPQTIDPSVFIQEYSNEDAIPYLDDANFSVVSDEMPMEYNTSYSKSSRTRSKELLHTTASVPEPQTGFTFVVEPDKPLPEHLPVVNEDTATHENDVQPNSKPAATAQTISNEEAEPPGVPFLDVADVSLLTRSANLPPPARPPPSKFLVNERHKVSMIPKADTASNLSTEAEQPPLPQQEKPKSFLKSDSLPPNFDFVPNLKLDKREKPKLKSRPNTFSKSESLPPGFGSELDAMKEAMEFAQARLKTAKELHEKRREGKITELPLRKKPVKEESLEGSEVEKPRILRSISLASNFSKSREFMKVQSGVAATQGTRELEKSGKWRSDEEFHELTSIELTKEKESKVGSAVTEPMVERNKDSVPVNELPPTGVTLTRNLNADANATVSLDQTEEMKSGQDSKREEETTTGSLEVLTGSQEPVIKKEPITIQNDFNFEFERQIGDKDIEALKEYAKGIPNVEDVVDIEEVEAETKDGSNMKFGTEIEDGDRNRLDELPSQNMKEELEKVTQVEKEMNEEKEKERLHKLEEEKDILLQPEDEEERKYKLEDEKERELQMEKDREEKERREQERIMAEEEERLERERMQKWEEERERERLEKEEEQRMLAEKRERERKLEEERQEEKMREKEMLRKLEEERERERKLAEEVKKERERVRKLEEERERERERARMLEEEKQREREMALKLEKEKERERELQEEIEKERERVRKLEEEREQEREKVRKLEEERELERERVRKLEEEREQERERVRQLEEERERERLEREKERSERQKMEKEMEQREKVRIAKEWEQKEMEKKLEEERERQRIEKEKEEKEKQRRMEKEREEKEMAMRLEAEKRRLERKRAEEREKMIKLQGEKAKERKTEARKSDEEREREIRMKEKERKPEGRKSDEEREKAWGRKSDEEKEKERGRRARKEREMEDRERDREDEEEERQREREKDRLAMERATQERAERIAIERITAARQRAVENREKEEMNTRGVGEGFEKKRPKGEEEKKERDGERNAREARLRAERAAVERATAEARERAIEKAKADADKERLERLKSFSRISSQDNGQESRFKRTQSDSALSQGHGESALRHRARLERQQRTAERAAKALAEKNRRDIMAQREQAERDRIAEHLDADVRRWSSGKEGNLRALLSTLQYILGQNSGWQPIHLTEVITAADVKRAYRKATLYVHPDKLQQRGASIQQKYICEKVFDLLKEAWNKFNSEER